MRYLILLLLIGCAQPDPLELVAALYPAASAACLRRIEAIEPVSLSQPDLKEACDVNIPIGGCSFAASDSVFIENGSDSKVLAHELMHVLLDCETRDSDHNHTRAVWAAL